MPNAGDLFALATQVGDECVQLEESRRKSEKCKLTTNLEGIITWAVHCATNLVLDRDDK
jgi:hypothetical protein